MHVDYLLGNTTTQYDGLVRSYVDEPLDDISEWTQKELLMHLNAEHKSLFSKIRNLYEDYFLRDKVFPLISNQFKYQLPRDCVNPRRIEFLDAQGVSGSAPNYVIDDKLASPEEVQEVMLSGKDNLRYYTSSNRVVATNGYYLYDRTIQFLDDSRVGPSFYARIYYLPTAPDLHRAKARGGSSNTIILGSNTDPDTLGRISNFDNYYKGMWIEIIDGPSKGEMGYVTQYDGATGVATIDSTWTPPTTASTYSVVSPIIEDFQELLALGTVLRAKGIKVEDDTSMVAEMYRDLFQSLVDSLERRNNQQNRRVIQTQRSGVWY